ncbi:hypothetical protein BDV93DRAFT_517295 [Ceratobasidium sp. AG-I]|nr:hypothetical protein BDV93DRAFT_517295 [Ceratobasidium sp. AG-I]
MIRSLILSLVFAFLVTLVTMPVAAFSKYPPIEPSEQSSDHAFRQGIYGIFVLITALLSIGYGICCILTHEVPPYRIKHRCRSGYGSDNCKQSYDRESSKRLLEGRLSLSGSTVILATSREGIHGSTTSSCDTRSAPSSVSAFNPLTRITSPLPAYSSPGRSSYQESTWSPTILSLGSVQPVYEAGIGVGANGLFSHPLRSSPQPSNKDTRVFSTEYDRGGTTHFTTRDSTFITLYFTRAAPRSLSTTHPNLESNPYWKAHQAVTHASCSGMHAIWV